ncbi:hypothetical protein NONO_c60660 [Nocardia nova SH22a]|uniref:Transposase n=1 Tax=Nocardia nova SH22a TaxID=1415166 RepID=W5TNL7_9NOCA|nr:hypothetical protein [Nocardia nova]AHH20842.1 hypothetical protein NONO_c60660 [Nocardia nova SH22a]
MSAGKNRGLVFEALLDCVDEDVPVSDETIRDWSRYVVEYLDRRGHAIRPKPDR